jgi:glycosyltransferase involved in cell wall biosynthesis/2-polyprenyl-3-methyl-5-hydroxy-6-metoxy-1,4-benzoquinol methylase
MTVDTKMRIAAHFDGLSAQRSAFFRHNRLYHQQIIEACRPFLNPGSRVLELGCSTGDLLAWLQPAEGVGVDLSPKSIEQACQRHPSYTWVCGDAENLPQGAPFDRPFDLIILADIVGYLQDIQATFDRLHRLTHVNSRIIVSHWNWLWTPLLSGAELLGVKAPDLRVRQNWVSSDTLSQLLYLADYEPLQNLSHLLFPYEVPFFTPLINSFSHAPLVRRLSLVKTVIARPLHPRPTATPASVTVVIPTRNEVENIAAAVARTPAMGTFTELLFIDGNSTDGTIEKIQAEIAAHPERPMRFMPQVPPHDPDANTPPDLMLKLGKGDAVRKAFSAAQGDIVMILDSDLTVPPEELPKFYEALVKNKGRFINGTRFIYPQEAGAMPIANRFGNVFFSLLFSWLLRQKVTDTLCGTKALYKKDYEAIAANRHIFGDFDPFGDFDLLFGAAYLGQTITEVPIHYRARQYGDSKVRVSLHGPLLGRMALIAFWHFKVRPLWRTKPIQAVLLGSSLFMLWALLRWLRPQGKKERKTYEIPPT